MSAVDPGVWVWAIFMLAALACAVAINIWANRSPITEPEPSRLDRMDGVGLKRCDGEHLCTGFALFIVTDNRGSSRHVCASCLQAGAIKGWWVA